MPATTAITIALAPCRENKPTAKAIAATRTRRNAAA
jgi:hypothetical protein